VLKYKTSRIILLREVILSLFALAKLAQTIIILKPMRVSR